MFYITSLLALFSIERDISLLGDKLYRVREAAQSRLIKRNLTAVAPLLRARTNDEEVKTRMAKILDAHWDKFIPSPENCPFIDSLSQTWGNYDGFVEKYHLAVKGMGNSGPKYEGDRYATWVMLQELKKQRVPPFVMKRMLANMEKRSGDYLESQGHGRPVGVMPRALRGTEGRGD